MAFTFPGYRVQLRPIRPDDVDRMMAWVNDPDVTGNFATMGHVTRAQEVAYLDGILASDTDRLFAIESADDGTYLGNVGIHKIFWPAKNGRLGLVIGDRAVQGRGLGQEALKLVIALGFRELGLHKLWVVHYRSNARMRHVVGKLGFVEEGVLRDEYFHAGSWHDMVRHSLLEPEFRARVADWGLPPCG